MLPSEIPEERVFQSNEFPELLTSTSSQQAEICFGSGCGVHQASTAPKPSSLAKNSSQICLTAHEFRQQLLPGFGCCQSAKAYSGEGTNVSQEEPVESQDEPPLKRQRGIENPGMDKERWSKLAPELVELIIHGLPATSLIRAQVVCRHWKHLARSIVSGNRETDTPWLMVQNRNANNGNSRWFFDMGLNKWHTIQAQAFDKTVCVAASAGRLCLYKDELRFARLYVFNPLSKELIPLPVLNGHVKLAVLGFDSNTCEFTVCAVILGRTGLVLRTFLQGSSRWSRSEVHTSKKLLKGVVDGVFFEDRLYCITYKNFAILKVFDVGGASWKDFPVKRPRILNVNLKKSPRLYLVESQFELMMVVRILGPWWEVPEDEESSSEGHRDDSFHRPPLEKKRVWIFKLDLEHMNWIEVKGIEGRILFLSRLGSRSVKAKGRGNLIYFAESEGNPHVIMYDVHNNTWEEFPPCPMPDDRPSPTSSLYTTYPGEGLWFEPLFH